MKHSDSLPSTRPINYVALPGWGSFTRRAPCVMVRSFPKGSTLLANATSDFLAFLVVVIFAKSGTPKGNKMPYLLRAIVQDATVYFLVIFTSHFVLEMFLLFATVSISAGGD